MHELNVSRGLRELRAVAQQRLNKKLRVRQKICVQFFRQILKFPSARLRALRADAQLPRVLVETRYMTAEAQRRMRQMQRKSMTTGFWSSPAFTSSSSAPLRSLQNFQNEPNDSTEFDRIRPFSTNLDHFRHTPQKCENEPTVHPPSDLLPVHGLTGKIVGPSLSLETRG